LIEPSSLRQYLNWTDKEI